MHLKTTKAGQPASLFPAGEGIDWQADCLSPMTSSQSPTDLHVKIVWASGKWILKHLQSFPLNLIQFLFTKLSTVCPPYPYCQDLLPADLPINTSNISKTVMLPKCWHMAKGYVIIFKWIEFIHKRIYMTMTAQKICKSGIMYSVLSGFGLLAEISLINLAGIIL